MTAVLEPLGQHMVTARSGDEALRWLLTEDFACILLDVQMPGLNGFETASLIRKREKNRQIPIIFVTAISREEAHILRGYSEGAVDYVVKPIDPNVLRAKVRVFVELAQKEILLREQAEIIQRQAALERAQLEAGRVAAQTEARQQRERWRALLRNSPSPVGLTLGPDHILTEANEPFLRGAGGRSLLGRPLGQSVPELEEQGFTSILNRAFVSGETYCAPAVEVNLPGEGESDGADYFSVVVEPMRQDDGSVEGLMLIGHDVTEQVQARQEAERLAEENGQLFRAARKAVSQRDEFISVASHELNTPLTSLSLRLDQLARRIREAECDGDLVTRTMPAIESAQRQTRRLSALVRDLLNVSRIAHGRLEPRVESLDLAALVREVTADFASQAEAVGATIHVVAPDKLDGEWDRLQLETIVTNLVSNALKYGAGKPVHVALNQADGAVRLVVRDEGVGIAAKDLDRVFERFERVASDNKVSGLGLGLYITRKIVEALGGTISIQSELGQGTAFQVCLPLRGACEPPQGTSAACH